MNTKTLIDYLLTYTTSPTVGDPYWTDVTHLLSLDKDQNTKGLPFYRDYSKYQRLTRSYTGSNLNSSIVVVSNSIDNDYPYITPTAGLNINSFIYIPNNLNQSLRLAEINSNNPTLINASNVFPTYIEVEQAGNFNIDVGSNDDFTIEFSFYYDGLSQSKYQSIWSIGACIISGFLFDTNTQLPVDNSALAIGRSFSGVSVVLENDDLYFFARGVKYLILANVSADTWYHIAIVRLNGNLTTYVNFSSTNVYNTTIFNINITSGVNTDTTLSRLYLGGIPFRYEQEFNSSNLYITNLNYIDSCFSGGISNFRITKQARYIQSIYSPNLPFAILDSANKIDANYSNVLVNLPLNYDLFDYSPNKAHFTNKLLLSKAVDYGTGFLILDGSNSYTTATIDTHLDDSAWTIEFYIAKVLNQLLDKFKPSGSNFTYYPEENTFLEWLQYYNVDTVYTELDLSIPLLEINIGSYKVLKISYKVLKKGAIGSYFALQVSEDGLNWLTIPSETSQNWNENDGFNPAYILPSNEIKFLKTSTRSITGLPNSNIDIQSGYSKPNCHIAIQRYNNNIYMLVNGNTIRTTAFSNDLYTTDGPITLTVGGVSEELLGSRNSTLYSLSLGIKGIKITNTLALYDINTTNDYNTLHELQPLALASNSIAPPRARVLQIVRTFISSSISSDTCSWYVYVTQPISTLVTADFTLTQLNGVSGASITSVTKESEYVYIVEADTGIGNGTLTLNFIDRHTLKYKDTNTYISYAVGELSLEGESYVINKNAPLPLLTSGSNPYINAPFDVDILFDSSIYTFHREKIGVMNGTVTNVVTVDEDNNIYRATISPIKQDPVIVQCIEGCGVTDAGILSAKSASLVRIYSKAFPILQLPLNIGSSFNDLSPAKLILNETSEGNTNYSVVEYPLGESSSLDVNPLLEQSGMYYTEFNSVASTLQTADSDWTIEFYLRIDSSSNKRSHILSIENGNLGFCVFCENKQLRLQRSVLNSSNILGVTISDIDTTNFISWDNNGYSQSQKYPHFAITKKGNVYRFYRNGLRIALVESTALIDISKGDLYVGYYPNRINDTSYKLSNVRLTLGKALYTTYQINVPGLPYTVLPNITEETELLNYISIYSNNTVAYKANTGNKIILKFSSIIPLTNIPIVTIAGKTPDIAVGTYNTYTASIDVEDTDTDGEVLFTISIENEPNLPDKLFNSTTNGSKVFIDNTPLEVTITSDSPNTDNYQFPILIEFSEEVSAFSLDNLTLVNCIASNIYHYVNTNKYSCTITANATGDVEITLLENVVTDLVGNYNLESNTFSRSCIVPAYVPDAHWSNVLLLIEAQNTITDLSDYNINLTINNVDIVNTTSPSGLSKSLFFNGTDSYINYELSQSLSSNIDYTIEFYLNISSSAVLRLEAPVASPAANITKDSFLASWSVIDDSSAYVVDVSLDSSFNTYVSEYKNLNVGNVTELEIKSIYEDISPVALPSEYIGKQGFIAKWKYADQPIGYLIDVSTDENFTDILYKYNNKFVIPKYTTIGNTTYEYIPYEEVVPVDPPTTDPDVNLASGIIFSGLLGNNTYPKLMYFLEESSIRLYKDNKYSMPAIAEDIDIARWMHIAIVNTTKYIYLYIDGVMQDKIKNISFSNDMFIGYSIGNFYGYMNALRITKGVARYNKDFNIPTLPYGKS